ncbi:MAG: SH3 domain-containing protein [Clostridia bacterium]|nr:SH3 domain-containing protein [Clostridia bacterium]
MKRAIVAALLAVCLALGFTAQAAQYNYAYEDYTNLLGSMEVVNVKNFTWLKDGTGAFARKLCKVPVGAVVTNCYYYDGKHTYCEYDGMAGYLPSGNLSFICGPVGYEYPDSAYLGNYQIVNCASYAVLRAYPDTSSQQLLRIPLGSIVTNVYYQDDRFSYCVYGNMDGYILNSNLSWVSGGSGGNGYGAQAYGDYIGTARIVNCISYASLRAYPSTGSTRLAKVPLGAYVTNCSIVDDRFAYCEYGGQAGYILIDNLGW